MHFGHNALRPTQGLAAAGEDVELATLAVDLQEVDGLLKRLGDSHGRDLNRLSEWLAGAYVLTDERVADVSRGVDPELDGPLGAADDGGLAAFDVPVRDIRA